MIKLQNIQRTFQVGDEVVHGLDNVSLTIDSGEYISVMGPSGSGKSTLLNVLGLLDKSNSGSYFLDGEDVSKLSELQQARVRRDKIGFIFQAFHLVPRLTAAENVGLPLTLAGVDHAERDQRVADVLKSLGMVDRAHHRPDQLSGGQRQRVAIARAVITKPVMLLADEPTGNLDHASSIDVISILKDLNKQGITLILVTHDPELGEKADRVIHMVDGKTKK